MFKKTNIVIYKRNKLTNASKSQPHISFLFKAPHMIVSFCEASVLLYSLVTRYILNWIKISEINLFAQIENWKRSLGLTCKCEPNRLQCQWYNLSSIILSLFLSKQNNRSSFVALGHYCREVRERQIGVPLLFSLGSLFYFHWGPW
jgi:hypothetical protein